MTEPRTQAELPGTDFHLLESTITEDEFYQVVELPADLGGLETALLAWNRVYEQVRPHQALGYKTPEQFYQEWLAIHHAGKGVLSDMS